MSTLAVRSIFTVCAFGTRVCVTHCSESGTFPCVDGSIIAHARTHEAFEHRTLAQQDVVPMYSKQNAIGKAALAAQAFVHVQL